MKPLAIVGSEAASYHGVHGTGSESYYETDYICYPDDFKELIRKRSQVQGYNLQWLKPTDAGMAAGFTVRSGGVPEHEVILDAEFIGRDNPSSQLVYDYILRTGDREQGWQSEVVYANVDTLYMLKMSHRYKKNSPHFLKTMKDIKFFRAAGAKIPDEELYKARMDATYGYSHPNLRRTKEEFFITTGELKYEYDHDSLHEAVAHLDRPMYTYYAVDGEQVLSDRSKFEGLSSDYERNLGVIEEAYVLALERSVIPFGTNQDVAFYMALEKVCTSITSGWFREWAWEHYSDVVRIYEMDNAVASYVTKFNRAVESGVAKKAT